MNLKLRDGTYYLRKTLDGDRKEISLQTAKKGEAVTKANRFLTTLEETGSWDVAAAELRGKPVLKKGESPTFERFKELYLQYVAASPKPIRPVTVTTNTNALKRLMDRLKAKTVADINPDKFKFTAENRKTITSEVKHAKAMFKPACVRFYAKHGAKVTNPFLGMELGGSKPNRYTALPAVVRRKIIEGGRELPPEDALIVVLAIEAGFRKNEIDKARVGWLHERDDSASLVIPVHEDDFTVKNEISREIPITKELAEEIRAIRAKLNPSEFDPYMVPGGGRAEVRKDKAFRRVNKWIKTTLAAHGIKLPENPLHSLRKEFGSHVFTKHGVGVACALLGHADIKLTASTYAGLTATPVIDVRGILKERTPLEQLAADYGVEPAKLKKWLEDHRKAA